LRFEISQAKATLKNALSKLPALAKELEKPKPVAFPDRASLEAAFGRFAPKNTAVVVDPVRITSWDHRKLAGTY
jgi:hypothetical protein